MNARPITPPKPRSLPRRRSTACAAGLALIFSAGLLLAPAGSARAQHMTLDYKASQATGYQSNGNPINTIGNNTSPLTFNDGTKDGRTYKIGIIPFDKTNPKSPVYEDKPTNATINYMNVLNKTFGADYSFNYGTSFDKTNEFSVQSYSVFASSGGSIGEDMYIVYNPTGKDPTNVPAGSLHWVQVIQDNWNITGKAGDTENIVDSAANSPFYDSDSAAGSTTINGKSVFNFYDRPTRNSPGLASYNFAKPIQWMAEDFLVYDTGKKSGGKEVINVYGGIEYGWQVTLQSVPEPSSVVLGGLGLAGAVAFSIRQRRRAGRPS